MIAVPLRKPGRPKNPALESRRREEILFTAAKLFAERGYADTDVQEIADAIGIGKGTIYRYFPAKQDLFLAAVDSGLADLSKEIDALFERESRDPLDLVRDAVTAYLRFFHRRPEMAELFIQERAVFRDRHTPLYFAEKYKKNDRDVPFIDALIRAGRFRKLASARTLEVICDLLYGTVLSNHLSRRTANPKQQAAAILDVVLHGMLSDAERRRIQRSTSRKLATGMVVAFACFALGCGGSTSASGDKTPEAAPIAITVEPLTTRTLQRTVTAVGTLNGFEETTLSPKVDGRVLTIRADIGDRVAPGAVLLELDPKDYELAIEEAKHALTAELAKIGLTALPTDEFDVEKVSSVRRAAATLEDATRRLKSKKNLQTGNAASQDEVDVIETEWKIAEASRNQAITEARAVLAAARLRKASLESAIQARADCSLKAPIPSSGSNLKYAIAQRMVSEGEMIRSMPVTNAFRLVLDHKLKLRVMVSEKHISEVAVGQAVEVTTEAYRDRTFHGRVTRVNPTVDSSNRTFTVEIEIPNDEGTLKCGGFAKASILTRSDDKVLTVPASAVVQFAGVTKVFIDDAGKAKAIEVRIGSRDKDWLEVIGPIPADAKVITSGLTQIVDGSAVRLRGEN